MPLTPEELDHLFALTLVHFNTSADGYWQVTRDHDVRQYIAIVPHSPVSERSIQFGCYKLP